MNDNNAGGLPIDTSNDLVVKDSHGNVVTEHTKMIERESYEVLLEGLREAGESAYLLARKDPDVRTNPGGDRAVLARRTYINLGMKLDQIRRIAVQQAGLGLVLKEKETRPDMADSGRSYIQERNRLFAGFEKAAGAARQLAVYFRADFNWLATATTLEQIAEKLRAKRSHVLTPQQRGLIVPGG